MNEKVKTLIYELAAEFNLTSEYFISLCSASSINIFKKDFNEFMNSCVEIDQDEDSIREVLLVLANGGILKDLISLGASKSLPFIENNFNEQLIS